MSPGPSARAISMLSGDAMAFEDVEIIDAHTHIQRSEEHARELWRYFLNRRGPGVLDEPPAYGTLDELADLTAETGVAHTNMLMFTWSGRYWRDGQYTLPDNPEARRTAQAELRGRIITRVHENNDWAVEACASRAGLSCFVGIDPVLEEPEALVDRVRGWLARGALGVKMVPFDLFVEGDDPQLWPIFEMCEETGTPVLTQASGAPGLHGRPARFEPALRDFPRLKLIFAHLGHDPDFGLGADAEVVDLANRFEGVHSDVSLRFAEVGDGHVSPDAMAAHLRAVGTDRVLYGSNFVFAEMRSTAYTRGVPEWTRTKESIEVLRTLPLTGDERADLAARNFRRLTDLPGG